MDINAGSLGINLGHTEDEVNQEVQKGEQWVNDEKARLRDLVQKGDKNQLLQLAQKYKADVSQDMNVQEIKGKIEEKLQQMK